MTEKLKDEYIREAAYYIWEKEGRPESDGYEFWMRAIKELSASKGKIVAAAKKAAAPAKSAPAKKVAKPAAKPIAKKPITVSKTTGSVVKKVAVKIPAKKAPVSLAKKK